MSKTGWMPNCVFHHLARWTMLALILFVPWPAASNEPCRVDKSTLHTLAREIDAPGISVDLRAEKLVRRAQYFNQHGHVAEAIDDYNAALALAPHLKTVYVLRGIAYAAQHRFLVALRDFDQALASNLAEAGVLVHRGAANYQLGRFAQAVEDYGGAIARNAADPLPYLGRANAYRDSRRYEEAIADYATAIGLAPHLADNYFERAIAYHRLDAFKRERADWAVAIDLKPEYYWLFGLVYRHRHLYNELWSDHHMAIRRRPDSAKAFYNRGQAHRSHDRYCQAVRDFTAAIEQRHGYAKAYLARGASYYALGAFDRAVADLSQALKRLPRTQAYYYRSLANAARGDYAQAGTDAASAARMSPANPIVKRLHEKLAAWRGRENGGGNDYVVTH